MPTLHALLFVWALLLLASGQVRAESPVAGLPRVDVDLQPESGALQARQQDERPAIALLKTSFGGGRGMIGLDWRRAVDGFQGGSRLNSGDVTDLQQGRENRVTSLLRVAVYTDGAVGYHRLDNSCRGNNADRCSMLSVSLGVHGASASMQWREDGARALVARREFSHDGLHLRFQVNYRF